MDRFSVRNIRKKRRRYLREILKPFILLHFLIMMILKFTRRINDQFKIRLTRPLQYTHLLDVYSLIYILT